MAPRVIKNAHRQLTLDEHRLAAHRVAGVVHGLAVVRAAVVAAHGVDPVRHAAPVGGPGEQQLGAAVLAVPLEGDRGRARHPADQDEGVALGDVPGRGQGRQGGVGEGDWDGSGGGSIV